MTAAAIPLPSVSSGVVADKTRRWLIALSVALGALLEIVDTSIVNVAMPQMQASLGVTLSEVGWVVTSYAIANVISQIQRPTLVLAHNKTLAAQLYGEFKEFFPDNSVEYFVSYYDYYQPEAYVPSSDTYIEKDASINEHIEQMRLSATKALLERSDAIIVATVSAIYGGAKMETQVKELQKGVEVVVATPGRMIDMIERKEIFLDDVDQVVLDEADRMADMGFLPQVEWILRHIPGQHQTLLFSATLDGVVDTLIKRYQADPVMHEVVSEDVTVEQMQHRFLAVHDMDKVRVAASIVRHASRTIVFVRTKRAADRVVMLYPLARLNPGDPQVVFDGPTADLDTTADVRVRQFVAGEAGDRLHELQGEIP